jgi:hypothetical protein
MNRELLTVAVVLAGCILLLMAHQPAYATEMRLGQQAHETDEGSCLYGYEGEKQMAVRCAFQRKSSRYISRPLDFEKLHIFAEFRIRDTLVSSFTMWRQELPQLIITCPLFHHLDYQFKIHIFPLLFNGQMNSKAAIVFIAITIAMLVLSAEVHLPETQRALAFVSYHGYKLRNLACIWLHGGHVHCV